jgi:hypothetical protein
LAGFRGTGLRFARPASPWRCRAAFHR